MNPAIVKKYIIVDNTVWEKKKPNDFAVILDTTIFITIKLKALPQYLFDTKKDTNDIPGNIPIAIPSPIPNNVM